ncbi:MAG TPA: AlpA family phage regulatory protein [Caulobacteraceae bacterium]
MTTPTPPIQRQLIRLPQVMARTGMSRSWLYGAIAQKRFPAPVKIGRASGWDAAAIDGWIAAQLSTAA